MNTSKNKKRAYKRITPRTVAITEAQAVFSGNNTQAVRDLEDTEGMSDDAIRQRAYRIIAKRNTETIGDYIENSLQQIGEDAMQTISNAVILGDVKAAEYVVDHLRGKAVQRTFSVTAKANIQSVLD